MHTYQTPSSCPRCGASTTCATCGRPMAGCIPSGLPPQPADLTRAQIRAGLACVTVYRCQPCVVTEAK